MSLRVSTLLRVLFGTVAVVVLAAGAAQLTAAPTFACSPFSIGTCPPLNQQSCWDACVEATFGGGFCDNNGCCECVD